MCLNTKKKMFNLVNPCHYSFRDLATAAFPTWTCNQINRLLDVYYFELYNQKDKDELLKKWCCLAGWFYKDVIGADGNMYISFSPEKINF